MSASSKSVPLQGGSTILVASRSPAEVDAWSSVLVAFAPVRVASHADEVRSALLLERPEMLVLDLEMPGLDTPTAVARARMLSSATRVVVLGNTVSEDDEMALFRAGVRGVCRRDIDPQLLKRIAVAVRLGELWIRRALVSRLLDEAGGSLCNDGRVRHVVVERLAYLTGREREIAALVGRGGTNKEIARHLRISERTVKAHLTEIFRKLRIDDRVKLALAVAGRGGA